MNYAKIKHFDIANGEGVRMSLFVSGCNFHCKDCFNEDAWDFDYGQKYTSYTHNELVGLINNPNIAGLSILGGDPLCQDEDGIIQLCRLANDVKELGKTIWIWSGYTFEHIMNNGTFGQKHLLSLCDVFVDGLFDFNKRDIRLKWKGSCNQRVIDVKQSLAEEKVVLYRGE